MSRLSEYIRATVHNGRGSSLVEVMSSNFTRISTRPDEDFDCEYDVSANELTIVLKPKSDYGHFIMRKVYDAECEEELTKK